MSHGISEVRSHAPCAWAPASKGKKHRYRIGNRLFQDLRLMLNAFFVRDFKD